MGGKIFYGWWIVLACFIIGSYTAFVVFYGFTAFFDPLVKEFGWSYAQVSFAASLRGLEVGIFAPFIGFLVDRLGGRKLVFAGVITVGLGLLLLSQTRSLAMFYASFFFLAFGGGGVASLVLMSVVANWFRKKVGLAFGIMTSGFGASGFLVPVLVQLIDSYGWRTALVMLALGMWILGIPLAFIVRSHPEPYGYFPDGDAPEGPILHPRREEQTKVLRERSFFFLAIIEIFRNIVFSAVSIHVMPYLGHLGMSRANAGLVAAAFPSSALSAGLALGGWVM